MVHLSEQERQDLALMVSDIFADWGLNSVQQLCLLGLPESGSARQLTRYRHGTALPDEEDVLDRAKHLLGIQEALHTVFPHAPGMPAHWLRRRSRYFHSSPPLEVMLDEGVNGMHWVWRHLDCTVDW